MKKTLYTDQAPAPVGPYSQALRCDRFLFVSGQIALAPDTGTLVGAEDIEQQTQQVMANLGAVLEAAGLSFTDVVKTTIYLVDLAHFDKVNRVYAGFFDEATAPARACVQVARLPKDAWVEIDCVAYFAAV